jgi:rare lipoprotein A
MTAHGARIAGARTGTVHRFAPRFVPRFAPRAALAASLVAALLAGCGSTPTRRGGFYQDDGPPRDVPAEIARTPDAVPRVEPFHPYANRPYSALGRSFTPLTGDAPLRQRGVASWYGRQFHGNRTATGERYDMFAMSAAHPTLPLPSYARVTNVRNGRTVIVRVNDRGPFKHDRIVDLSYAAAHRLGIVEAGSGEVELERITHADIRAGRSGGDAAAAPGGGVPVSQRSPLPPPAPGGAWAVQLGAFEVAAHAESLRESAAARLARSDDPDAAPHTARVERDGRLFRVLVGSLADRAAAQRLADRLERLLGRETALFVR